jgi:hypothetical protein
MKVILTEGQIKTLQEYETVSNVLAEAFNKSNDLKSIYSSIKKLIYAGVAAATIIAVVNKQDVSQTLKDDIVNFVEECTYSIEDSDEYKLKLDACRKYMGMALKNQNFTFNSTRLKPETLVKASIETGFDLPFLLAAAHQESCFGATNRSKRTNSVFNVGSYDDGRDVVKYKDPNQSVYGYISLLENDYLVDGKTIFDLLKPGKFVNYDNKRYASDKQYENKLRRLRNKILKMYPELA